MRDTVRAILVPAQADEIVREQRCCRSGCWSCTKRTGRSTVPARQQQRRSNDKEREDGSRRAAPRRRSTRKSRRSARNCAMSATPRPGSPATPRRTASTTACRTARWCATSRRCGASARWPFRRPGPRCGSASTRTAICRRPAATQRGRKQYRYHPRWREVRDEAKYGKLLVFAQALPLIRARVEADLKRRGLPREKVLAAIVRLMEMTLIPRRQRRIREGQQELRPDDAARPPRRDRGRQDPHQLSRQERQAARDRHQRPPARPHRQGLPRPAGLRTVPVHRRGRRAARPSTRPTSTTTCARSPARTSPPRISAPGPRTHLAAQALREFEQFDSDAKRKKAIVDAVKKVATHLGNTPAICRRSYIHPAVLDGYMDGTLLQGAGGRDAALSRREHPRHEAGGGGSDRLPAAAPRRTR